MTPEASPPPESSSAPGVDSSSESASRRSGLYREFLAEREEILRHKWLRSEQAGRDIGFDDALVDWMHNHRSEWRRSRNGRQPHHQTQSSVST